MKIVDRTSDILLLREKVLKSALSRSLPVGLICFSITVFLLSVITQDAFVLIAIPSVCVYSMAYSLFLHMGIKPEFREPGSYSLSMDNAVLSLFLTLISCAIIIYPAFIFINILGLLDVSSHLAISIVGISFFSYYMRLSSRVYPDADLDHVFGASFVPFALVCVAIYFI